ncbi:hypothetical protein ZIOFF_043728 [Zingiber officinale]|uniref:phosphoglycerate mutase (2,3-diphosphoglycerate-dependent) n=2 Tax=Zingiber officinale TaxID=94328 RepID=A0A8J5G426_ZINOF|nr:hypothetical protein ZIOFF_043728 [Zingiber officinale]
MKISNPTMRKWSSSEEERPARVRGTREREIGWCLREGKEETSDCGSAILVLVLLNFFRMATGAHLHAMGCMQGQMKNHSNGSQNLAGSSQLRMVNESFYTDLRLFRQDNLHFKIWKLSMACMSGSQFLVADPIESSSIRSSCDNHRRNNETALILLRHGESMWNEKNLFTGCVDVPLTQKGANEAIEAGKRICSIPVDMIYTSVLIRAQMTAMLAMAQHRSKKVPIIVHNESEQAQTWSNVYSAKTKKESIPVITAWQLNERMYGELQGLNKQETADQFGKEKVHEWRRSFNIPPPNGESLEMCAQRAVSYFKEQIEPQLSLGKNVMIAAHGNSLRSIIMYLDNLTSQEVINLELSTGIPMLYVFKEGNFIRRGNPTGPSEAGVYAYTKNLALYRQKLDDMPE